MWSVLELDVCHPLRTGSLVQGRDMLAVILCWTVILIASFGYGRILFPDKRALTGIRLYAGLLISCAILMALANVLRVSLWLGLAVEAVGIALAINHRIPWAV